MAAVVTYSLDGGATFKTPKGDTWPSTTGLHLVRLETLDAAYSRRIIVRITSTDADVWGVRQIILKGQREPQEASLT